MPELAHKYFIRAGLHDIDYRINYLETEADALAGNASFKEYQRRAT
jgi:hypothetical protein